MKNNLENTNKKARILLFGLFNYETSFTSCCPLYNNPLFFMWLYRSINLIPLIIPQKQLTQRYILFVTSSLFGSIISNAHLAYLK